MPLPTRTALSALTAALLVLSGGCAGSTPASTPAPTHRPASVTPTSHPSTARAPRWRHVVVVLEENHAYGQIIGSREAPYFTHLASTGVNFVQFFAETHPSQPNYLALFSGSTHGVTDDSCPHTFTGNNLGHQLLASGYSFVGYSEGLPHAGSQVCTSGDYARKHAPWVNFSDLPSRFNQPFTAFPTNLARLPDVSFVIPDLEHDMHNGTVAQADTWLRIRLGRYARWAGAHRSLLLVTWDEDDDTARNQIPTIAVGAGITRGPSRQRLNHYSLLRTLEDAFHLAHLDHAAHAVPAQALGG